MVDNVDNAYEFHLLSLRRTPEGKVRMAVAEALADLFKLDAPYYPPATASMLARILLAVDELDTGTITDALNNDDHKGIILAHDEDASVVFHPVYAFAYHDLHVEVKTMITECNDLAGLRGSAALTLRRWEVRLSQ